MEIRKNIYRNFVAGLFGKFGQIGIRLIQVPILIDYLGVEQYGVWILISSIPAWLNISNLGFGSVSGNDAALASGENNKEKIAEIYTSTLVGVMYLVIFLAVLSLIVVGFVNWSSLLNTTITDEKNLKITLIALSFTVIFGFLPQIESIKYRVNNKNHRGIWFGNMRPWIDITLLWVAIRLDLGMVGIALSGLVGMVIYSSLLFIDTHLHCYAIKFSLKNVRKDYALHLIKKGVVFQAFPISHALQNQGYIMVVNYLLGPLAVTLFTTLRTLVRSANQVMELINQSVWPELSYLLGAKKMKEAREVHDKSVKVSGLAALAIVTGLLIVGPTLYSFWLGNAVEIKLALLVWFIFPIPLTAWWYTSSVVLLASNQYEGYAVRYIIVSFIGLILALYLGIQFAMPGIAVSIAVIDIMMIWYVRRASLRILTGTTNLELKN